MAAISVTCIASVRINGTRSGSTFSGWTRALLILDGVPELRGMMTSVSGDFRESRELLVEFACPASFGKTLEECRIRIGEILHSPSDFEVSGIYCRELQPKTKPRIGATCTS